MNNDKADFTQGSILKKLIAFMIPVLGALILQAAYGAVDLLVVGRFGSTSGLSAVSTGSQIMQSVTTVITGIAMGITVLVGQKIGEKRPHEAGIIGSGIATSVLAGLCLSYLFYTYVLYFDAQNHIGVPTSIKLPSKS